MFFPQHPQFSFGTLRAFGRIAYGGAGFGEAVVTAQRITAGDYESWHDEWLATAGRGVAVPGSGGVPVRGHRRAYYRPLHRNSSSRLEATWMSTATAGNFLSR